MTTYTPPPAPPGPPPWEPPPAGPPPAPPAPPPHKRHTGRNVAIIAATLLVVGGIGTAVGVGLGSSGTSTAPQPAATQPATQPVTTAPAPVTVPADTVPPAAPAYTIEQQQAIDSAQSYLDMGTGFSKRGLMEQLTSSAGEGFSHQLARFALAHISVDWNEQAVLSAQGYVDMGGFSYASLVDQLHSPYGEGFTLAQAQHGATVALGR